MYGSPTPRVGPPVPARSKVKDLEAAAKDIGIRFMPWQSYLGRFSEALGPGDEWLYHEIAAVVSRQNGKTTFVLPHIMRRLRMGRRLLHAGQTRELPRLTFNQLAPLVEARYPKAKVRRGAGQETIEVPGGGVYRITAASSGGPRGWSVDDLIVDEVREIGEDFIQAALPTMAASPNPQTLYLSNAGHEGSTVLNSLRKRAEEDPSLAYLEWSSAPSRSATDRDGWLEANPAIGHIPGLIKFLERAYASHQLAGTLGHFETENLCRWVISTRRRLVEEFAWVDCAAVELETPSRRFIGIGMDPEGRRASIVQAWRQKDDTIAVRLAAEVTGEPFSVEDFGELVRTHARGAVGVAYDPLTDAALARFVKKPKPEPVSGQKFSNASAQFTNLVNAGLLRWKDADAVTDDLGWTARKDEGDEGAYQAVRSDDEHPITAALAAIRAVWLASAKKVPAARVM